MWSLRRWCAQQHPGLAARPPWACSGAQPRAKMLVLLFATALGGCMGSSGELDWQSLDGRVNRDGTPSCQATITNLVVEPIYAGFARWNDYIEASTLSPIPASNPTARLTIGSPAACNVGTLKAPHHCIHGGELRRVRLPGVSSCFGLWARDELDAFEWSCAVINGQATIYTQGLRPWRGLKDLIDSTGTAWRPNSVTVQQSNCSSPRAVTSLSTWWTNPISPLSSGTLSTVLTGVGSIFTVPQLITVPTGGLVLADDKIAVVTLDGGRLVPHAGTYLPNCALDGGPGTAFAAIICTRQHHPWIETQIETESGASTINYGIYIAGGARHGRIHSARVGAKGSASLQHGISIRDSSGVVAGWELSGVSTFRTATLGIELTAAAHNLLRDVTAANTPIGVRLSGGSQLNVLHRVLAHSNSTSGLSIEATALSVPSNNTVVRFTAAGSTQSGGSVANAVNIDGSLNTTETAGNSIHLATITNTGATDDTALRLSGNSIGSRSVAQTALTKIVIGGTQARGLFLSAAINTIVSELAFVFPPVLAGSPQTIRSSDSAYSRFLTPIRRRGTVTCGNAGTQIDPALSSACLTDVVHPPTQPPIDTLDTNTEAFVGAVTVDDAFNGSDFNGYSTFATIFDWLSFETLWHRSWGREGAIGAHSLADTRSGLCLSGDCRIMDWRLRASDNFLRPWANTAASEFVVGASCPSLVDPMNPSNVITDSRTPAQTYLLHAFETVGDRLGDEDGLCESNERCVFAPNHGAWQGDQSAWGTCQFSSSAAVSGVEMSAFSDSAVSGI